MKIHSSSFLIKKRCHTLKHVETVRYLSNLLVIVFTFLLWLPATYSQNEVGNIHGKLTDIKLDKPIANHLVTLNIYNAADVTRQETKTDENGTYRFENLPIDAETHYTISTTYNGVAYTEKDLVLSSFVPNLPVNIEITAPTDDPSQIRIKSYTIVIGLPPEDHATDGAVAVIEALDVENLSNSPFQTTRENKVVGFNLDLPKGYEAFHPHVPTSLKRSSTGNRIVLSDPLPPGPTQVGYRYIFHANKNKLDLSRRLHFRADQISILIPAGINLAPHSKYFKTTDYEVINNVVYKVYPAAPASGFSAGKTVSLKLGIPKQKFNIGQVVFIAIAASLAGGFLAAAIFMLRARHRTPVESYASQAITFDSGWLRKLSDADLEHARTTRLEFITLLDKAHEKQEISERVYNRLRKEQTERLTEIINQRQERGLDN